MTAVEPLNDPDEYAVILTVIRAAFMRPLDTRITREPPTPAPPDPQARLLISEQTWGQGRLRLFDYQKFIGKRPGPSRCSYSEQEGDWINKNSFEPRRLMPEFFGPERVFLLPAAEKQELFEGSEIEVWKKLGERYQLRGVITVSRVGFDTARQHALIAVGWTGGAKYGFGGDYLLERDDDGWRITGMDRQWMS